MKRLCRSWNAAAFAALALIGSACHGSSPTTPSLTTTTTTTTSAGTDTFSSVLPAGGAGFEVFSPTQAGTVSVALVGAGPPSTIVLGFGVGMKTGTSGCSFAVSMNAAAGDASQISVPVDPGTYCAGVYDVGNIGPTPVSFSLRITHP